MKIKFAKCNKNAKIPTRSKGNAGFDIYVVPDEDENKCYVIRPNETKLLPTGLKSIIEEGYYVQIQERGSTGSKGIKYGAGVIDSSYRGEWFLAVTNTNNKNLYIADLDKLEEAFNNPDILDDRLEEFLGEDAEKYKKLLNIFASMISDDEEQTKKLLEPDFERFKKENVVYDINKAIFQGIIHKVEDAEFEEVSLKEVENDTTDRGEGKLGSSGK